MSNFLIAFLFAAGAGTWIYTRVQAKTGGNTQQALVVAGLSGLLFFLFMLLVLSIVGNIISSSF